MILLLLFEHLGLGCWFGGFKSLSLKFLPVQVNLTPPPPPQLTCHPISLSGSGQVVLFAVMRLPQLEEILQSQELTDALPDRPTRHQSVSSIIHQ